MNSRHEPLLDLEGDVDPKAQEEMRIDAMLDRAHQPGRDALREKESVTDWLRRQFE
jgi:hypothetical protein